MHHTFLNMKFKPQSSMILKITKILENMMIFLQLCNITAPLQILNVLHADFHVQVSYEGGGEGKNHTDFIFKVQVISFIHSLFLL